MELVKKGDAILHFKNKEGIVGISIAASATDSSFIVPKGAHWDYNNGDTPGLVASAFILSRFSREVECARDTQHIINSINTSIKTLGEALESIDKARKQISSANNNLDVAEKKIENAKDQLSTRQSEQPQMT